MSQGILLPFFFASKTLKVEKQINILDFNLDKYTPHKIVQKSWWYQMK